MSYSRLFFLHNPKAGGSSLRALLSNLVGHATTAPVIDYGPNHYREHAPTSEDISGFDLYFGHCGYETYSAVNEGHSVVTNFRDPVQRVYSIYQYWKFNVSLDDLDHIHPGDAEVVRLAQQLPFSEFIRSSSGDVKLYISNFHFRQLYKSGWLDCGTSFWAKSTVKRRIRRMPWFYVAETPQASVSLLRGLFPSATELSIPKENQSRGVARPVSDRDARHLIGINLLDYEIYAYAVKLQTARLVNALY